MPYYVSSGTGQHDSASGSDRRGINSRGLRSAFETADAPLPSINPVPPGDRQLVDDSTHGSGQVNRSFSITPPTTDHGGRISAPPMANNEQAQCGPTADSGDAHGPRSTTPQTADSRQVHGGRSITAPTATNVTGTGNTQYPAVNETSLSRLTVVIREALLSLVRDRQYTWFDFFKHLKKHVTSVCMETLVTDEGHNLLHEMVLHKRVSHIDCLQKLGLLTRLATQKIPTQGHSPYPNSNAAKVAEESNSPRMKRELERLLRVEESMSDLHRAARAGDVDKVKALLHRHITGGRYRASGMDIIKAKDSEGSTALHWACISGSDKVAKDLVKAGADCSTLNDIGLSPLHVAAKYGGGASITSFLLKQSRAQADIRDKLGRVPFEYAAMNGDKDSSDALYAGGVRPAAIVIILAAFLGHLKYIKHALTKYCLSETARDKEGRTCLMVAVEQGHTQIVKFLLNNYTFKMDDTNQQQRNVFHMASRNASVDLVQILVDEAREQGVLSEALSAKDIHRVSQHMVTLRGLDQGRAGWHQIHKKRSLEPWLKTTTRGGTVDGRRAGTIVCSGWGEQPSTDILNINVTDYIRDNAHCLKEGEQDMTPLMMAAFHDKHDIAQIYIEAGADVTAVDCFNLAPLHMAAANGNVSLCHLLMEKGASANAKDNQGKTASDIAKDNVQHDVCSLLKTDDDIKMTADTLEEMTRSMQNLQHSQLCDVKREGRDVREHVIQVTRHLQNQLTRLLISLNSGPLMQVSEVLDGIETPAHILGLTRQQHHAMAQG